MDLEDLLRRMEYERGGEHGDTEVLLLIPGGRVYDVLSLNWDAEHGRWLICGEKAAS